MLSPKAEIAYCPLGTTAVAVTKYGDTAAFPQSLIHSPILDSGPLLRFHTSKLPLCNPAMTVPSEVTVTDESTEGNLEHLKICTKDLGDAKLDVKGRNQGVSCHCFACSSKD